MNAREFLRVAALGLLFAALLGVLRPQAAQAQASAPEGATSSPVQGGNLSYDQSHVGAWILVVGSVAVFALGFIGGRQR